MDIVCTVDDHLRVLHNSKVLMISHSKPRKYTHIESWKKEEENLAKFEQKCV